MAKIIDDTGKEYKIGDTILNFRNEEAIIKSITLPRGSSSGRINTNKGSYYPSVFNCKIEVEND